MKYETLHYIDSPKLFVSSFDKKTVTSKLKHDLPALHFAKILKHIKHGLS